MQFGIQNQKLYAAGAFEKVLKIVYFKGFFVKSPILRPLATPQGSVYDIEIENAWYTFSIKRFRETSLFYPNKTQ